MSIAIKGMDMPTSCSRCPCSNDASRFCRVVEEYIPMLGKPAFCPLVDVPDTNVGDTISRQAAIEEIARRDTTDGTVKVFSGKEVISILKELPSAQPERKGKWIKDSDVAFYWKCSECGAYLIWRKEDYLLRHEDEARFCPNCGAKMEERE